VVTCVSAVYAMLVSAAREAAGAAGEHTEAAMSGKVPLNVPEFKNVVMPAVVRALDEWRGEAEKSARARRRGGRGRGCWAGGRAGGGKRGVAAREGRRGALIPSRPPLYPPPPPKNPAPLNATPSDTRHASHPPVAIMPAATRTAHPKRPSATPIPQTTARIHTPDQPQWPSCWSRWSGPT
jgi:hypothetical protein